MSEGVGVTLVLIQWDGEAGEASETEEEEGGMRGREYVCSIAVVLETSLELGPGSKSGLGEWGRRRRIS